MLFPKLMLLITVAICNALVLPNVRSSQQTVLQAEKKKGTLQAPSTRPAYLRVLYDLASTALSQDNVFVLLDPDVQPQIDMDYICLEVLPKFKSYVIMTWTVFNNSTFNIPQTFFRGDSMVMLIIYYESPINFFIDRLTSWVWNPEYIMLFNLNPNLNSMEIMTDKLVQRSKFMVSLEFNVERGDHFKVVTVHLAKTDNNETLQRKHFGFYDKHKFENKSNLFPNRFGNFNGLVLDLASWCDDMPFLFRDGESCAGINIEMLDAISKKLNFAYTWQQQPEDLLWGSRINGTWTGMLGEMMDAGKHMVINNFILTEQRNAYFDTSYPYCTDDFAFVIKKPHPAPQWLGLLYPFTGFVWACFIGVTILMCILMTLALYFVPDKQPYDTVFLLILGGVIRQSVPESLSGTWVRQWAVWWWLAGFVISAAYTTNLVAFLTVPALNERINTIDELAASDIRVCMADYGTFVPEALKASSDESLLELGHKLDMFPFEEDIDTYTTIGFPSVNANSHALLEGTAYVKFLRKIYNQTATTYIMKEKIYPSYMAWYWPKNTPYSSVISDNLQRFVEAGIVWKRYDEIMSYGTLIVEEPGWQVMKLESFQGPFFLLCIGLIISCLTFCGEVLTHRLTPQTLLTMPNIE